MWIYYIYFDYAGFYGVTYCLGFRDDFDVQVMTTLSSQQLLATYSPTQIAEIIDRICLLEERANPEGSAALLKEIRNVAESYTHM